MEDLRIAIVGDASVGKTALAVRFTQGVFDPYLKQNTGGVSYERQITLQDETVKIQIWDTAGQEQYQSLAPFYYRGAHVIIIVFALGDCHPDAPNSRSSFDNVEKWYNQIRDNNANAIIILCGSMSDLENREITFEEGQQRAQTLPDFIQYFETSSVTGFGINDLFKYAAQRFLEFRTGKSFDGDDENLDGPVKLNDDNQNDGKGGWFSWLFC
ncbi:small GTP-binding protein [Histomonas meleagridis]|uniref:small GTP-binding protein n=1 Tax=Histomonas meleagridis TaxID=135588 RepID=UPI00355AA00B|nr:small GTP-binding protein [Histomonas meleagridis]KAH0804862.1 small GTP-binding protein [Histomonas meleagridis]